MQKIQDLSEYKTAISSVKKNLGAYDSNCLLMPENIKKWIGQNRFYMQEYEHGTTFWVDENKYFCLYYFWQKGAKLADFHQEKPVMIEESNRNGVRDAYLAEFEPVLKEAGFHLFKTNLQMEMNLSGKKCVLEERLAVGLCRLKELGFTPVFSDGKETMEQSIALWESALDLTDIPLDHRTLGEQDSLLCILDAEGKVIATNWWRITGKSVEGRHLVTHSDYYHKGLASFMLAQEYLCALEAGAVRVLGWAHDDNWKSLALHNKAGLSVNGNICKQYVLY